MTWYIALTKDKKTFPVLADENILLNTGSSEPIEIPKTDINSKFTLDMKTWIITETFPEIDSAKVELHWKIRQYAQLVAFQKMAVLPDMNKLMATRKTYLGKTIVIDGEDYQLTMLHGNYYFGATFSCLKNGDYTKIVFNNDFEDTCCIAVNGQWIQKPIVWKKML